MFKKRLMTALLLTPLVLLLICYANSAVVKATIILVGCLCGLEWTSLIPLHSRLLQCLFLIGLIGMTALMNLMFPFWLYFGLVIWTGLVLAVIGFPRSQKIWGYRSHVMFMGWMLLPLFMEGLIKLYQHPKGKGWMIYVLCLVWASDIGAYVVGKLCGRHRLIPAVSPGKTWEGSMGGVILALFVGLIGYRYYSEYPLSHWLLLAMLVTLAAIYGDLTISMLKRRVHLKDTGHLLPGHGGVLDRLDSLLFAVPCFYFGVLFLLSGFSS